MLHWERGVTASLCVCTHVVQLLCNNNSPQLQHIDHVKVDNIKYFHGLIITNRTEESSFGTDCNAFYHTCRKYKNNINTYRNIQDMLYLTIQCNVQESQHIAPSSSCHVL